jgi:hypothetical protein
MDQTPRQSYHASQRPQGPLIIAAIALILGAFGTGLGVYATVKVTAPR